MDNYQTDVIPLGYEWNRGGTRVTGMTVTVQVTNASSGAVLLATTSVPEIGTSGVYAYNWTHGLAVPTAVLAKYVATVGGITRTQDDSMLILPPTSPARGA